MYINELKKILYLTIIVVFSGCAPKKAPFDLTNSEQVHQSMRIFLNALKNNDSKTEMKYREAQVTWWNKVKKGLGTKIEKEQSLSEVGDLKKVDFTQLEIDITEKQISRVIYKFEEKGVKKKNRYLFYVSENGKIDGVLFIPPLPEITAKKIEHDRPEELIERDYMMRCGLYRPMIEELLPDSVLKDPDLHELPKD